MNLKKLFEMQTKLDVHILLEKGLVGHDLIQKKILAFQVELGELSNELPEVFKYWSNKKNDYEKALKEYVDGLHFILSIGLVMELDDRPNSLIYTIEMKPDNLVLMFQEVFSHASDLFWACYHEEDPESEEMSFKSLLSNFIQLGEMLGFTWAQIEAAYYAKNKINHVRQAEGY